MEERIEIEKRLTETEGRSKSNTKRIDKLENQYDLIMDMNSNIKVLVEQNSTQTKTIENVELNLNSFKTEVKQDMSSLKKDVDDIKTQPDKDNANTYKKLKWEIVKYLVIAILGFLVGKFFNLL